MRMRIIRGTQCIFVDVNFSSRSLLYKRIQKKEMMMNKLRATAISLSLILPFMAFANEAENTPQEIVAEKGCWASKPKDCCKEGPRGHRGKQGEKGEKGERGRRGATGPALGNFVSAWQPTEVIERDWTPVNFSAISQINAWTHPNDTDFVCPKTGVYFVAYRIGIDNGDSMSDPTTIFARALINGTEIPQSRSAFYNGVSGANFLTSLSSNFCVTCAAGDTITFEFNGLVDSSSPGRESGSSIQSGASVSIIQIN